MSVESYNVVKICHKSDENDGGPGERAHRHERCQASARVHPKRTPSSTEVHHADDHDFPI